VSVGHLTSYEVTFNIVVSILKIYGLAKFLHEFVWMAFLYLGKVERRQSSLHPSRQVWCSPSGLEKSADGQSQTFGT